jgi:hypothetical protein
LWDGGKEGHLEIRDFSFSKEWMSLSNMKVISDDVWNPIRGITLTGKERRRHEKATRPNERGEGQGATVEP